MTAAGVFGPMNYDDERSDWVGGSTIRITSASPSANQPNRKELKLSVSRVKEAATEEEKTQLELRSAFEKAYSETASEVADAFASAFKEKAAEHKEVEEMRRRAEAGDGWAMHALGHWYGNGMKGLEKDLNKSFEWISKSHEANCAAGTSELGRFYLNGEGVQRNQVHGMTLLAEAAMLGSQCACFKLGVSYANGFDGMPEDKQAAKRWFAKVESASVKDLVPASVHEASWFSTWLEQQP